VIRADNVTVRFSKGAFRSKFNALDGLSMEINEGDFFALLGRNGAGKSTAMYCFLGLIRPDSGSIQLFGKTPELGSELYRHVAYLPEEPHYHLYLTVEEAVRYYGSLYGERVSAARVNDVLERVGLAEFRSMRLDRCSKGMKQKAGIAQCLIRRPRLLFMDEPTRGLDPVIVKEFRDILVELNRAGTTIVMNSHVLSETEMVASRVAIIEKGRLLLQDYMSNLLVSETDAYVVECEAPQAVPDYIGGPRKSSKGIRFELPAERLYDFMDFARQEGLKIFECSHKKATLEESFLKIVKEVRDNA